MLSSNSLHTYTAQLDTQHEGGEEEAATTSRGSSDPTLDSLEARGPFRSEAVQDFSLQLSQLFGHVFFEVSARLLRNVGDVHSLRRVEHCLQSSISLQAYHYQHNATYLCLTLHPALGIFLRFSK